MLQAIPRDENIVEEAERDGDALSWTGFDFTNQHLLFAGSAVGI